MHDTGRDISILRSRVSTRENDAIPVVRAMGGQEWGSSIRILLKDADTMSGERLIDRMKSEAVSAPALHIIQQMHRFQVPQLQPSTLTSWDNIAQRKYYVRGSSRAVIATQNCIDGSS